MKKNITQWNIHLLGLNNDGCVTTINFKNAMAIIRMEKSLARCALCCCSNKRVRAVQVEQLLVCQVHVAWQVIIA